MTCRYLFQRDDEALMFSQKGRLLWTRHEALARLRHSLMLPLPAMGNPHAAAPRPPISLASHFELNMLVLKVCFLFVSALRSGKVALLLQNGLAASGLPHGNGAR